jgi:hypothetical protein
MRSQAEDRFLNPQNFCDICERQIAGDFCGYCADEEDYSVEEWANVSEFDARYESDKGDGQ